MNEFIQCYSKLPPDAQNALVIALEFFASFERYAREAAQGIDLSLFERQKPAPSED